MSGYNQQAQEGVDKEREGERLSEGTPYAERQATVLALNAVRKVLAFDLPRCFPSSLWSCSTEEIVNGWRSDLMFSKSLRWRHEVDMS